MSDLLDLIVDTFPANNDTGVPLRTSISLTLSGLNYNEASLKEGFFVEGPDTDQFVGPGLIELTSPDNISQGSLDDFLQSPGYTGIVTGDVTVTGVAGNTLITFTSAHPLVPELTYVVNLSDVLDAGSVAIDGFVSFSFETGSGSIETIPSTVSTSVLSSSVIESTAPTDTLKILSITPGNRSIQNPTTLDEIIITFNKDIDPLSVDVDSFGLSTLPATDHPNATVSGVRELTKTIEVSGNLIKLKI
jgi:hypothetical protein